MHRILHIIPSLSPSGTATQLSLLQPGLPKSEFEVHVAVLDRPAHAAPAMPSDGVESTVFIGRRGVVDPLAFWRLKRHLQRLRPALVHSWLFAANTYGRAAALAAGVRHLVATERHVDVGKTSLELWLDRRLAARTWQIVANSAAVKAFYVKHGLPAEKITLIPAGVPVASAQALARPDFLAQRGLPTNAQCVVYLGSLAKHKRLKELIWAVDQLKAVELPVHLLVVGGGPCRQQLERYAWQNRVDQRVHFLGERADGAPWLSSGNLLWQAGNCEGHSQAILEAMAAGIPVVAADAQGNRELVVPGETGYLVPLSERAGFARYSLPLLDDPALARRLGAAGLLRASQRHSVGQMLAKHLEVYRHALA